eukprot:CAMPEP_0179066922 /NCGR_PEP_ID=MMETSP0796-20121207/29226_1 /TAXON_ID=73915 /ORGANISM="Pyrodinium bahamense, Strain pbaha01" /LENGTH=51 /DNA_ID=CAMNT_0020763941 /DNA_START=160 /DNA_END=315 /DNA_ORIENTATION=+
MAEREALQASGCKVEVRCCTHRDEECEGCWAREEPNHQKRSAPELHVVMDC